MLLSDDIDMYNTSSDAFKTIKDALESGQVGSDDMRAAMELLMSQDQYKEFLKAGHSEENALEKQYLFMEKWADTNKKFFGDDMKQNAINFFEYLDKTGLLADGVLATSEEIGKQTGLSVDAVNSLIQFGNMYGFQDIIQQSQIDYVDDYVEKMQNLQSAKEAFQQANESDPNSNITLGLKDDLSNAQKELDDFYADIPKKFNDISEEYMNTTTDKSLGEYFTEQMGGDDNTLAYMQSIGDRLKYIDQEKNRLSVQNKDKGIFSTSQYKALEDEESVLESIQEQLETSNLDLYSPTDYQLIYAQQGDINSRYLRFKIWDEGEPYVFPKDMEVNLLGERPDGASITKTISDIDFNKNIIAYLLDKDVICVGGIVNLKLTLLYGNGQVISTIPFKIRVTKNPLDDNKVIIMPEYTTLTKTLSEVKKMKTELDATHRVVVSQTEPSDLKVGDEWLYFYE